MFRRISLICFVVVSLFLLAFSTMQLSAAYAAPLEQAATATRTRTRTPTRSVTPTRSLTPSRTPTMSPTPLVSVVGSVGLEYTAAPYGQTSYMTAFFSAQSNVAQVTQMRKVATWGSDCMDVTTYASWEAYTTSQVYEHTNWGTDQYFAIAVQYQDALGNLSPIYCNTTVIPAAPTPTASNTPTLIPTVSGAAPDLTVVSISVVYQNGTYSGSCRLADAPVALRAVIQNIGAQDAGPFSAVFNGSTSSFSGLAAGQTVEITTTYGTLSLYARTATVDSTNVIAELDENNNTLTVTPSIAPMCTVTPTPTANPVLPDLIIGNVGLSVIDPSLIAPGGCYYSALVYGVSVEVKNIGGVSAGPFSINLTDATNNVTQVVNGLAAGQSVSLWLNFSASRPITITADSTNAVIESNENNSLTLYNSSGTATRTGTPRPPAVICTKTPTPTLATPTETPTATRTPTVTPVGTNDVLKPDLTVILMAATPSSPACANMPYVAVVVKNNGPVGAGAFSVSFNTAVQTVSSLASGQQIALSFPLNTVIAGTNTATADSTGVIAESNESNNTLSGLIAMPAAGPTCTPTASISPTPSRTPTATPIVGGCSPVTATITAPFTQDGVGTFCWQSSNLGAYINSWNLSSLTLNGVNILNAYVPSSSYPAQIGGYWYVSYSSAVAWGHFEAK